MSQVDVLRQIASIIQKIANPSTNDAFSVNVNNMPSDNSLTQSEITDAILDALDGTNDGKFSGTSIFNR